MNTNHRLIKSIKIGFDILFFLFILLIAVNIIVSVIGLAEPFYARTLSNIPISVVPDTHTHLDTELLMPDVQAEPDVLHSKIYLKLTGAGLENLPVYIIFIQLLCANIILFVVLYILIKARQIIHSVYQNKKDIRKNLSKVVFHEKNLLRFRSIAISFLCIPLVELVVYFTDIVYSIPYLQTLMVFPGYEIKPAYSLWDISWDYIFVSLFLLIIVEIIRRGIQLQTENDLTV